MLLKLRIICLTKDNCYCDAINVIDKSFDDDPKNSGENIYGSLLSMFFPDYNSSSDEEKIVSGFIMLLNIFNDIADEENIDSDKLIEYAILWLSYKLNQKTQNGTTTLNYFYTNHIKTNSHYNQKTIDDSGNKINMGVIDTKIESMNMNIKDISNFYDSFKSLCNVYSELDPEKTQCKTCLENAGEFFEKYEKLKNVSNTIEGSPNSQLWSSLLNDYEKFENKYNSV
ncbi:hypothetical protein YYC_02829, partial [Plasmodium yoelii 17X]